MGATLFFSQKLPTEPPARFAALETMGYAPLVTIHQEHGDAIVPFAAPYTHPGTDVLMARQPHGDALITNQPGLFIGVKTADCLPILLWDDEAGVCAAIHAGWRGTAAGIARKTALHLIEQWGASRRGLQAAMGPCICPQCFETHRDVPDALPDWAASCIRPLPEGKFQVDLPAVNRMWLERAGLERITPPAVCTACRPDLYWSHRRHGTKRGLQVSLIGFM